jgi:polysaccharide biosynthesis protein PslH
MRILYVLPFVPWPVKVRSLNLIPRLARSHEVHLLALAQSQAELARANNVSHHCASVTLVRRTKWPALFNCMAAVFTQTPLRIAYFRCKEMRTSAEKQINNIRPDVIYVERWRTLQYVTGLSEIPIVCDPTDCMTLFNERLMQGGGFLERIIGRHEWKRFRTYERRLGLQSDCVVFCSEVDKKFYKALAPDVNCVTVPNGVDCTVHRRKDIADEESETLIFTGAFTYGPNRHAVKNFLNRILPLIKQQVPRVKFLIVGFGALKACSEWVSRDPRIEVHDWVPDLHPYIARAAVAVVPLQLGVGVSNKILEALSTETAVVTTKLACGDLRVIDGEHLLIADDEQQFAEKVIRLIRDPAGRRAMAIKGGRFVRERYDWEIVADEMKNTVTACQRQSPSSLMQITAGKMDL